jgi:predicted lipoprotein with Yx(FWY)xxD motif
MVLGSCGGEEAEVTADSSGTTLVVTEDQGRQLLEQDGEVLYAFSRDVQGGGSACFGSCAKKWIPLMADGVPRAGDGAKEALVDTIHRPDGNPQVTYGDWPLYEKQGGNSADPGEEVNAFGGRWHPMQGNGKPLGYVPPSSPAAFKFVAEPALISVHRLPKVGQVLLDSSPKTYYYFSRDKRGAGTSACYGRCARFWVPKPSGGTPEVIGGAKRSLAGTFGRKDGAAQATYNGWPLYTYISEKNEKTNGFGIKAFGGEFGVIRPDGSRVVP